MRGFFLSFLPIFTIISDANQHGRYVSELLYIHTKLMIVDDRRVIVSANSSCHAPTNSYMLRWAQRTSTTAV